MKKYKWIYLVASCILALQAEAKVKLPTILSDGMILQRNAPIKVWGTADAQEKVTVVFKKKKYETQADNEGSWQLTLSPSKEGGPYTMTVNGQTLKDILVGDVFLCSGQSNMELPVSRVMEKFATEISTYSNPRIRQIKIPQAYNFHQPQTDIAPVSWNAVEEKHVQDFSAIAYFFAKTLYEKTHVPVGIINSSWGGTPVESWISESSLKAHPMYLHDKWICESDEFIRKTKETEDLANRLWYETLYKADEGLHAATPWYAETFNDKDWIDKDLFSTDWGTNGLNPVNGSHWFRKTIIIPESWSGKQAVLWLGRIVDGDSVYINGKFAGTVSYQYPPRIYTIPAGLVKPGKNTITVRLISNAGYPEFVKDKPYKICCGTEEVSLEGQWKYHIGAEMPQAPSTTFFNYKPVGLYNSMIHPLKNYVINGVVWYQGESNVSRRNEYAGLLSTMIQDWRHTFNNPGLPFYIVELADFLAPDNPGRKAWAEFRQEQAEAAKENTATYLIRNSDTGEWNDIHPLDKKTPGIRIAEQVEKNLSDR